MKILNINKFYYIQGGADRHFLDLEKLLIQKGHTVTPFSMKNKKNLPTPYSKYFVSKVDLSKVNFKTNVFKIASRILYSFEARKKIKIIIKKEKPDIAHIHNIYHQISPSILGVLKKNKIPIVMTVHDYKLICPNYSLFQKNQICEKCKKHRYYQCFLNQCVKDSLAASFLNMIEMYFHKFFRFYERYVDLFICPSEFLREKLIQWGLPEKKLLTLPYFVKPLNAKSKLKTKSYILYFGRLSKEKGLDQLLTVMKKLPEIKLKIVGTGPEKTKLLTFIRQNQLENVQFLGYLQGQKLKKIILESRFVIVPSIWQEIFGLVILESFRLGKTVLAAKKGGMIEIIQEGNTGFFFSNAKDLEQKIRVLYAHPKVTEKIGRHASLEIQKYHPDLFYQKLIKIYRYLKQKNGYQNT